MPAVNYTAWYDLGDYFDKYGLDDGDDSFLANTARSNQDLAVDILNKHLKKNKLPLTASAVSMYSLHNEVRIHIHKSKKAFRNPANYNKEIQVEGSHYEVNVEGGQKMVDGVTIGHECDLPEKVRTAFSQKVWPAAFKEFEKRAK